MHKEITNSASLQMSSIERNVRTYDRIRSNTVNSHSVLISTENRIGFIIDVIVSYGKLDLFVSIAL